MAGLAIGSIVGKLKIPVRQTDLIQGGTLRQGTGLEILSRQRDINLRELAVSKLGVEPAKLPERTGEVRRSAAEDFSSLVEAAEMRRAAGERPSVSLQEVLAEAGIKREKIASLSLRDLFNAMQTDNERFAFLEGLDPAVRAALFRELNTSGRAALKKAVVGDSHLSLVLTIIEIEEAHPLPDDGRRVF